MSQPSETGASEQHIAARETVSRAARLFLLIAAIVFVAFCVRRAQASWSNDANMDHVAGVWAAMSQDLLHGVFYRPIAGPLGYGGTRYVPLFFLLHAGLWKALGSWRVAGHLIGGASVVALLAGIYVLLRRFAVERWLAFGAAAVVLAGAGGKYALLDIRADGLAAALNLWGFIVATGVAPGLRSVNLGSPPFLSVGKAGDESSPSNFSRKTDTRNGKSWLRIISASLLFTLVFGTKITTVFGVAAAVVWLWLEHRRSLGAWLGGATGVGYVLVLALTNAFSDGRFFQIMRATASGGASGVFFISAPMRLISELTNNPTDTFLLAVAVAALITSRHAVPPASTTTISGTSSPALAGSYAFWHSPITLFFFATLAVTLIIFGSPGTVGNHFIDLEVASVLAIVVAIAPHRHRREFAALAFATLLSIMTVRYVQESRDDDMEPYRQHYANIERAVRSTGKPVLAENPIIAIDAGQRPYILDPFMLRVIAARDEKLVEPLWTRLEHRDFGAVVLEFDARTDEGKYVYQSIHFGDPFLQHLTANYDFVKQVGDLYVWKPKGASALYLEDE